MTYLHDYTTARKAIQTDIAPKIIAAVMPILDRLGADYEALPGEESGLIVSMPNGTLPDGYRLRIDFTAVNTAPWKAPDGTDTKGPGGF